MPVPRGGGLAVVDGVPGRRSWSSCQSNAERPAPARAICARPPSSRRSCSAARSRPALGAIDDLFDLRARWQLAGQIAPGLRRGRASGSRSTSSPTRSAAGRHPVRGRVARRRVHDLLDRRDDQQHQLDRRPRRPVDRGSRFIAAVTLGLISLHERTVDQPLIAVLCFALAGRAARVPALELPPGDRSSPGPAASSSSATRWPSSRSSARPRSPSRCSSSASRSSTRSGSSSGGVSQGRSPFSPDRGHIHHRLLDLGPVAPPDRARDLRHLPRPRGPGAGCCPA